MSDKLATRRQRLSVLDSVVLDIVQQVASTGAESGDAMRHAVHESALEWALESAARIVDAFPHIPDGERFARAAQALGYLEAARWSLAACEPKSRREFNDSVSKVLDLVGETLRQKNIEYGNSALSPIRVFSKAPATDGLCVRIDDKLSRIQTTGYGKRGEDTLLDLICYLVLLYMGEEQANLIGDSK
jgi:hypothetical protein